MNATKLHWCHVNIGSGNGWGNVDPDYAAIRSQRNQANGDVKLGPKVWSGDIKQSWLPVIRNIRHCSKMHACATKIVQMKKDKISYQISFQLGEFCLVALESCCVLLTLCRRHLHGFQVHLLQLRKKRGFYINSLAPGRCGNNLKSIIFKLIIQNNSSLGTHCETALRWMPQNLTNEKVPSSNKPLPKPMLTQIYVTISMGECKKDVTPEH